MLIDSAGFNLAPSDRPWLLRVTGSPALAAMIERCAHASAVKGPSFVEESYLSRAPRDSFAFWAIAVWP
jgi:hypothetical protein